MEMCHYHVWVKSGSSRGQVKVKSGSSQGQVRVRSRSSLGQVRVKSWSIQVRVMSGLSTLQLLSVMSVLDVILRLKSIFSLVIYKSPALGATKTLIQWWQTWGRIKTHRIVAGVSSQKVSLISLFFLCSLCVSVISWTLRFLLISLFHSVDPRKQRNRAVQKMLLIWHFFRPIGVLTNPLYF